MNSRHYSFRWWPIAFSIDWQGFYIELRRTGPDDDASF